MTRKDLKILGLALAIALAIGTAFAASAWAQPFGFKWEAGKSEVTGTSEGKLSWTFGYGVVNCTELEQGNEVEGEGSSVEHLEFTGGECEFKAAPVIIDFNGCGFEWEAGTFEGGNYEGSTSIFCPVGKRIEITANGCTITVFAQQKLKKVTYTNKGAKENREITVDLDVTGVTYEEDKFGLFPQCLNPGKKMTNGTLKGSRTLTAENNNGEMGGLWVQ